MEQRKPEWLQKEGNNKNLKISWMQYFQVITQLKLIHFLQNAQSCTLEKTSYVIV